MPNRCSPRHPDTWYHMTNRQIAPPPPGPPGERGFAHVTAPLLPCSCPIRAIPNDTAPRAVAGRTKPPSTTVRSRPRSNELGIRRGRRPALGGAPQIQRVITPRAELVQKVTERGRDWKHALRSQPSERDSPRETDHESRGLTRRHPRQSRENAEGGPPPTRRYTVHRHTQTKDTPTPPPPSLPFPLWALPRNGGPTNTTPQHSRARK